MPAPDPLAEAEVFLRYGRTARATELLKAASLREPDRLDIKQRLEEMMADRTRTAQLLPVEWNRIPMAVHALVACVLWICSMAVPGYVLFRLTMPFASKIALPDSPALALFVIFCGIAFVAVVAVTLGVALFSVTWFGYLTRVVNVDAIPNVEAKVAAVIALRRMEPMYGWVRRSVYGLG
jgi:hypothetical protein